MSVDAKLYFNGDIDPAFIVLAVAKAIGVDKEKYEIEGKMNCYMAERLLATFDHSKLGFNEIQDEHFSDYGLTGMWIHYTNDFYFGNTWYLSRKALPGTIAVLRTIAEQLGGLLITNDCTDECVLYPYPRNNKGFTIYEELINLIEKAVITDNDKKISAYVRNVI